MTSTIPSKKPYRKAPPQHREIRHELPILHDDQDGVILVEQSQVTETRAAKDLGPVHEQKGFSDTKAGRLKQQMDGYEVCSVNFSSSWSLASSSDKEIGGRRTALNLKSQALSPVLLHSGRMRKRSVKRCRQTSRRQLGRFMSRSAETVAVPGDEGRRPTCSFKSRSLERSLVFKEPAEVLAPRKFHVPPIHLPLKGILKQTDTLEVQHENLCKSRSVESLARSCCSRKYSDPQVCLSRQGKPCPPEQTSISTAGSVRRREKIIEEKLQFSRFLDEITHRVLSPAHLHSLGQCRAGEGSQDSLTSPRCSTPERQKEGWPEGANWTAEKSPHLSQRKAEWRSEGSGMASCPKKPPEEMEMTARLRRKLILEPLTDAERMKLLQHENEELHRRLACVTNKMEAMERELQSGQDYLELELGQNREELEKFKDKFRRLQNSYTASQRTNQDLEEKLHALIKKAEMDRKTLDWEIVELTNKLLDAKTTINKLEELNERYRQDCNLAVQLLKCNKSHFRNHKFADLPYELQDMVNKHLHSTQESLGPSQEALHTLAPSDVVPTFVIARVLEKPESLVLNSAKSSSGSCPVAEDVFVHVDMSGTLPADGPGSGQSGREEAEGGRQQNGGYKPQSSLESSPGEVPAFEKLSPYPTPPPPHPMYPGRKVIEFSEDKVRIPKNSPLPNCTYATRQAISLSLVQGEEENCDRQRTLPSSPASEGQRSASSCSYQPSPKVSRAHGSSQSSPFSSPPQVPSTFASSASSEEDLLANWQRMFVDKAPPTTERVLVNRTSFSRDTAQELQKRFSRSMQELGRAACAYSDGEESVQSCSWTVSRDSSVDTDSTESRAHRSHLSSNYDTVFSQDEVHKLLQGGGMDEGVAELPSSSPPEKQKDCVDIDLPTSPAEEREMLLRVNDENCQEATPEPSRECRSKPPSGRPHRSPKRMGVHHLHRKDSLTQAQEQGNLLN